MWRALLELETFGRCEAKCLGRRNQRHGHVVHHERLAVAVAPTRAGSAVTHTPRAVRLKIDEVRIVQLGPHTWMQ
eukprot:3819066-Prymnesium_polylepis.1